MLRSSFTKMTITTVKEIETLQKACNKLINEEKIRHVAVINKLGKSVADSFKDGITRYLDDDKVKMVYMQLLLDFRMREELDEILGPIDYIASKRKNITLISVPTEKYLIVISAERDVSSTNIVKKAEELFDIIDLK